jgi:hypothetical protein
MRRIELHIELHIDMRRERHTQPLEQERGARESYRNASLVKSFSEERP